MTIASGGEVLVASDGITWLSIVTIVLAVLVLACIFLSCCCCPSPTPRRQLDDEQIIELQRTNEARNGAGCSASHPQGLENDSNGPSRLEASTSFKIIIGAAYLTLNTVLNLLNKWALSQYGFKFPMVLTAAHISFGTIALLPLMLLKRSYRRQHGPTLRTEWRGVLFVGCMNGPQIAVNNASLVTIELSLNQVIRAGIPVCVACFAFCLERKKPTAIGAFYLMLICVSVMLTMLTGNEQGETVGITLCGAGVLMQSLQMSLAGKLMSSKLDSLQLTFYTGPVALVTLVMMEGIFQSEFAEFVEFAHAHVLPTLGITVGGACIALAYNIVLMQSVRSISAVGTAVLGNFRTAFLVFMSALVLGELETWGPLRWVGCINTLVGAAAYGLHPKICKQPVVRPIGASGEALNSVQGPGKGSNDDKNSRSRRAANKKSKSQRASHTSGREEFEDDELDAQMGTRSEGTKRILPIRPSHAAERTGGYVVQLTPSAPRGQVDQEMKKLPKKVRRQVLVDVCGLDSKKMSKAAKRQMLAEALEKLADSDSDDSD